MAYVLTFLSGIIAFISPCLLPMLPIYISFMAGSNPSGHSRGTFLNALGFVCGFSAVFVLMGAAAATFGAFVRNMMPTFNVVAGLFVIVLGLHFTGWVNIPLLNKTKKLETQVSVVGFASAFLFGMVFAVGWTPCVGPLLGSALMLAADAATATQGALLLAAYAMGMAIPFLLSALFINKLKNTFAFIKRHYRVINVASGLFLICLGIFILTGRLNTFISFFRF